MHVGPSGRGREPFKLDILRHGPSTAVTRAFFEEKDREGEMHLVGTGTGNEIIAAIIAKLVPLSRPFVPLKYYEARDRRLVGRHCGLVMTISPCATPTPRTAHRAAPAHTLHGHTTPYP